MKKIIKSFESFNNGDKNIEKLMAMYPIGTTFYHDGLDARFVITGFKPDDDYEVIGDFYYKGKLVSPGHDMQFSSLLEPDNTGTFSWEVE